MRTDSEFRGSASYRDSENINGYTIRGCRSLYAPLSNQYHDMAALLVHGKPTKHTRKHCPIFCLAILISQRFLSKASAQRWSSSLAERRLLKVRRKFWELGKIKDKMYRASREQATCHLEIYTSIGSLSPSRKIYTQNTAWSTSFVSRRIVRTSVVRVFLIKKHKKASSIFSCLSIRVYVRWYEWIAIATCKSRKSNRVVK